MLNELLKKAVVAVVGKQAEEIAPLINSKKPVNEFLIAKKLNLTINQTRNILYKLSNKGLVFSTRKKDKKKGWYTYFWKIEIMKSLEFLRKDLLKKINQFQERIHSRESKQFFVCKRCGIEFSEENALLRDFICPECGEVLSLKDDTKLIREMNKHIEKFKRELKIVEEEIKAEQLKLDKIRNKEIKAREKERLKKKEEAARKRRQTRKAKLKQNKKTKSKIIKKIKKKIIKKKIKKTTFKIKKSKVKNKSKKKTLKKIKKKISLKTSKKKGKKR